MSAAAAAEWRPLKALLGGGIEVPADIEVSDLTLDSREVRAGAAFLACRGRTHHGVEFAADAVAAGARAILWEPAPGTGAHWSPPGEAEYRAEDAQSAAKSAPPPEHCAQTAKTRWPAVSSAVTRRPWVSIRVQVLPASWVAQSCGPKAQPSLVL